MNRYVLKTLGCKANVCDSQAIEAELQRRGWCPFSEHIPSQSEEEVRLCIVNSCTVTDEADRQSRKTASRFCRLYPKAKVIVTGCSAEVDPERLSHSQGIHYVVGNRDKPKLVDLVLQVLESTNTEIANSGQVLGRAEGYAEMRSRHPEDREWPLVENEVEPSSERTRAFLKIQEGCNSFCTYCVIPYGRGPSRSLEGSQIIEQIRALVDRGVRELVLTGTNIGDYGADWNDGPAALEKLIEKILSSTQLERLRVSSLDPIEITPGILELMRTNPRFCPHFHVSLQSPHSRVLRLMKRKYGWKEFENCLNRIADIAGTMERRVLGGVFVGMDLITGFPGETDEDFEASFQALSSVPWDRLHVFPYSERKGTPATRLPGAVPKTESARRAEKLRHLSLERLTQNSQKVLEASKSLKQPLDSILLEGAVRAPEGASGRWLAGYTPNYLRVFVPVDGKSERQTNALVSAYPNELLVDARSGDVVFIAL